MQKIVEERKKAKAAEKARKQHAKEILKRIDQEEYEKAKAGREASERMEKVREAREDGNGQNQHPSATRQSQKSGAEGTRRGNPASVPGSGGYGAGIHWGKDHVPSSVRCRTGKWMEKYTRFAVLVEPGKIALLEAGEDHSRDEVVMGDTRKIAMPVRLTESAGWRDGDAIKVRYHGREIVLEVMK